MVGASSQVDVMGTAIPQGHPSTLNPGLSPYHESSQFRHWRFSRQQLSDLRQALNEKSKQVVAKNTQLEKEAQKSLGHQYTEPPGPAAYLSVEDELVLIRFYCSSISQLCRTVFSRPDVVEETAISYLKRFYLKNSVMEWHPKEVMPTCLYLAAKTTNRPIPMDDFIPRFAKLTPANISDTEFLVAQSLGFEFWVRGAEKALRGWTLDMQSMPGINIDHIASAINPKSASNALNHLLTSRLTDAEFLFTPSQIGLACIRLSNPQMVDAFLDWKYAEAPDHELPYGIAQQRLLEILNEIDDMIRAGEGGVEANEAKVVDKRLKGCRNPEKIPGTALYAKRKREQEDSLASVKAEKTRRTKEKMDSDSMVFGGDIKIKEEGRPMSPRVSMGSDRGLGGGA